MSRFTEPPLVLALALVLFAGGCGDDDESGGTTAPSDATATAPAEGPQSELESQTDELATSKPETETAPPGESDEGDEQPISTRVVFTARGGRITPRTTKVPPFILIFARLELPAGEPRSYTLKIGGKTLRVGQRRSSDFSTLLPLRPGESYVGRAAGGNNVRIEASFEPE